MLESHVHEKYRQAQVSTTGPAGLVLMLYSAAYRFLMKAGEALGEGRVSEAGQALSRVQDILGELMCALNPEAGEMTGRLGALYAFMRRHLLLAHLRKDRRMVEQVAELVAQLRAAWMEGMRGDRG